MEKPVPPPPDRGSIMEKKTDEPLASVSPPAHEWGIRDMDKIMEQFQNTADKITEYLKLHTEDIPDSERTRMTEELDKFRKSMEPWPELNSGKLDRIISLIEKKNDSKTLQAPLSPVKAKIPHPETGKKTVAEKPAEPKPLEKEQVASDTGKEKTVIAQKAPDPDPVQKKESPVPESVPQKLETFKKTAENEEKTPEFPIPDNILTNQEVSALRKMEDGAVSAKTLCKNRQNTVHFLSSQLLVRLVDIHPPDDPGSAGRAVIDVTHPRLGLRRFSEMEEGTTRPFEYGSGVFFLELLKLYPNCADVAVYERKNS